MNRMTRGLVSLLALLALVAATMIGSTPAHATVPGHNGRIVFGRYNPAIDSYDIYTANPDGTDEVEVLDGPADAPRWSPDGSRIGLAGRGFLTMNPDGSDVVQLVADPTLNEGDGPWSPDGRRIAFEGWDDVHPERTPGVFSMRSADGGDLVRMTSNPYGGHDIPQDYAPDGSRLLFVRTNPLKDPQNPDLGALFVVNVDGTGLRQITPWDLNATHAGWSPDGKLIVFRSDAVTTSRFKRGIFLIRPDGDGLRLITHDRGGDVSFAPTWSPDGNKILFGRYVQHLGQEDLYTMNRDGTGVRQVTHTPDFEQWPDWGTHQED